ncbi:MAG TPA: class I SAM-dependent methyltransferase, partial [Phycisphaerales bacterium]|nr:class I SAM-dependent methyltransferase [Phycisphaerales bacterium]
ELRVTDVGGGSSILARRLAERECEVRVMDISSAAIERGKARAGECGERVQWMVGDVTRVDELPACDVWHDRAAFHFLTSEADRARYVRLAERTVREDGYLIVGTFADDGPERCSGLMVERYGEEQLRKVFANGFEVVEMKRAGHMTPWGKEQRFLWGVFRRGR